MLTIYRKCWTLQKERVQCEKGRYTDHLHDTESDGHCRRKESSVKGGGMLTIYMIQKVLDTAEGESPV